MSAPMVHYTDPNQKKNKEDFIVFVKSEAALTKWKDEFKALKGDDATLDVTPVIDGKNQIFTSRGQGTQGTLGEVSNQVRDNYFSLDNDLKEKEKFQAAVQRILDKGEFRSADAPVNEKKGNTRSQNDSHGTLAGH